jgi:hypothetical protein
MVKRSTLDWLTLLGFFWYLADRAPSFPCVGVGGSLFLLPLTMQAVILSLIVLFVVFSSPEEVTERAPNECGHETVMQSPWYLEHADEIQKLRRQVAEGKHLFARDTRVLRIPVVWHVLGCA